MKSFLTYAGWLLSYEKPIALIVDQEHAARTVCDLRLIALDNVLGYWTPDVVDAWQAAGNVLQTIPVITADDVARAQTTGDAVILDVRNSAEYQEGHLAGALNVPMGYIPRRIDEIPADRPIIVHCLSGVRSAIASGMLQSLGRTDVLDYCGSYQDWVDSGHPVERGVPEPAPVGD
jgi:hydroxyacylglutathione hydrolase